LFRTESQNFFSTFFCHPWDSATWGGGTTRPTLVPPTVSGNNQVKTVDSAVIMKKCECNNCYSVQGSWNTD